MTVIDHVRTTWKGMDEGTMEEVTLPKILVFILWDPASLRKVRDNDFKAKEE